MRNTKTEHARARAWLRLAINEHSLESYISVLLQDKSLLSAQYDKFAFLRDDACADSLRKHLAAISFTMTFNLFVSIVPLLCVSSMQLIRILRALSRARAGRWTPTRLSLSLRPSPRK